MLTGSLGLKRHRGYQKYLFPTWNFIDPGYRGRQSHFVHRRGDQEKVLSMVNGIGKTRMGSLHILYSNFLPGQGGSKQVILKWGIKNLR